MLPKPDSQTHPISKTYILFVNCPDPDTEMGTSYLAGIAKSRTGAPWHVYCFTFWHRSIGCIKQETNMNDRKSSKYVSTASVPPLGGEGDREADRNYREGVRETVKKTTAEERSKKARDISPKDLQEARQAEKEGKSRAKT